MKQIVAILALVLVTPHAFSQKSPDEALKSLTVADGLQVQLFAAEPHFVNPTCIDVDYKGRVWVCESVNYRCDLHKRPRHRAEGDRLVVLIDSDGDGNADKAQTFYQEKDFLAPLGVAVAPHANGIGQSVYVCHSPNIYVLEDRDGDLKADGPPQVLLTGFKGYDHDHGVHGIHFGPDGKLYFSVGDQGVQNLQASDGKGPKWSTNRTDCQAGTMWRCNPDGTRLELLAHNFRNQYEPAVDSYGTMFTSDNDDDGNQQTRICHVLYGGNHGYWPRGKGESHWHEEQPGIVHKALRTYFGSPTGLCWYEGEILREPFGKLNAGGGKGPLYGYLLHTDAGPREVRCFAVKQKGAGYELDQVNLLTSSDNWFRPSDVCVAPDGSLFVSDWYDPGVGGHGMGDQTRGRIYRITAKGKDRYEVPVVNFETKEGLQRAFLSPNLSCRQGAWLALAAKPEADRVVFADGLESMNVALHDSSRLGWLRATTKDFEATISKTYAELMKRDDAEMAAMLRRVVQMKLYEAHSPFILMARVLRDHHGSPAATPETIRQFFFKLAQGLGHPATNREMLLALRDTDPAIAKDWIYALAKAYDGQDPFYRAAIGIAVGTDPRRREVILADFTKHFPEWNDKVASLVWELRPPDVIATLDERLADASVGTDQRAQLLGILTVTEGEAAGKVLLKLLAAPSTSPEELALAAKSIATFLPTKWANLKKSPELNVALARLLVTPTDAGLGIDLIVAGELADFVPQLLTLAENEGQAGAVRSAATRALGRFKTAQALAAIKKLLPSDALQRDAIQALGTMQTPEAQAALEGLVVNDSTKDEVRLDAVQALASSRNGTSWLLKAHQDKQLHASLVPEAARLLRNSPHQDLRNKALIAFPVAGRMDLKKLPEIASLVTRRGSPEQGRELFTKNKDAGCVRCHSIRGAGGSVGPDLSMIGKKASKENLFESILNPDKAIADQFVQWNVLDNKGVLLTGLLVEETPEHVILRDAHGKDSKILLKDVDQRAKNNKSIMASDLAAFLSEQDLIDVVAYLETLKTPAFNVEYWHVLGPFENGQGDEGLKKVYVPEPTPEAPAGHQPERIGDPAQTAVGKHGPIGWRKLRPNGMNYFDLAAFHAPHQAQTVSYLYQRIESPTEQEATILIGTDDGCKLWVNGTLALEHARHESALPERDQVKIKLKKGTNDLWLKINNGDGPHGFYFTILSSEELNLATR